MANSKKPVMRLNPTQAASVAALLSRKIKDVEDVVIGNNQKKINELASMLIRKYKLTQLLTFIQKSPAKTSLGITIPELRCDITFDTTTNLKQLQDDVTSEVTAILDGEFRYVQENEIKHKLIRDSVIKPFSADLENEVLKYYTEGKVAQFNAAYQELHKKLK